MILGNFLKSFAQLFHLIVQAYIFIIIIRSVISWLGNIPYNTFILILRRLTDPVFRFVHKTLPFTVVGGIDISPIIIIVILYFVDSFFTGIMIGYANKLLIGSQIINGEVLR